MKLEKILQGIILQVVLLLLFGIDTSAPAAGSSVQDYFEEGMSLNKQQRYDEAIDNLTHAVELDLENHKYHQALFMTYLATRRGLKAIEVYKEMARKHPKSATTHYWLGRLYLQSQSLDDATREFLVATRLAPRDEHAWISLGHIYYRQGKDAEAMAAYQEANRLSPKIAVVHGSLGSLYLKKNDYPNARKELEEALRIDPSQSEARYNLSLIYEKSGDLSKAMKEWQKLLDDDPNESQARERLARAYFRMEQYEDAVREYTLLSQVRQSSPEVFFALGEAQVMLAASLPDSDDKIRLRDLAIQSFQRVVELDPKNAQARQYLDRLKSKGPSLGGK